MEDLPGKIEIDKFGNKIKLCPKCDVPIHLNGAVVVCENGCQFGHINWRPNDPEPSEDNDYNPVVTKMCGNCRLDGHTYHCEGGKWFAKTCDACNGQGSIKERKYEDGEGEVELKVNDKGRAKCPKCNFTFLITDKNVWSGNRHRRCGQKLKIPKGWLLY